MPSIAIVYGYVMNQEPYILSSYVMDCGFVWVLCSLHSLEIHIIFHLLDRPTVRRLSYRHCRRSKSLPIINRRYTTGVAAVCLSRNNRISAAADHQRSFAMRGHSVHTSSDSLAFQLWSYGLSFGRRRLLVSATQSYLIMSVWIIYALLMHIA